LESWLNWVVLKKSASYRQTRSSHEIGTLSKNLSCWEAIMNNDNKDRCFTIVVGGVFILCPIIVVLYGLVFTPIKMKVFLLVWMLFVILCNTFESDNLTRIVLSIMPTMIYAFSFATWYADDVLDGYYGGGGLGDTIGMFFSVWITLVPLMLIGAWFRASIERKNRNNSRLRFN